MKDIINSINFGLHKVRTNHNMIQSNIGLIDNLNWNIIKDLRFYKKKWNYNYEHWLLQQVNPFLHVLQVQVPLGFDP